MADETLCAIADGIATITLNRPERGNALNTAMLDELRRRFDELERDARVRVVVLRGAGTAFCSGRDLEEMSRRQRDAQEPEADVISLFQHIEASSRPSIAMVHGPAYAGAGEAKRRPPAARPRPATPSTTAPATGWPAGRGAAPTPKGAGGRCSRSATPRPAASDLRAPPLPGPGGDCGNRRARDRVVVAGV